MSCNFVFPFKLEMVISMSIILFVTFLGLFWELFQFEAVEVNAVHTQMS